MYTSREVIEEVGITYRQLNFWCNQGYIPGVKDWPGSGNVREYPQEAVDFLKAVAALVEEGYTVRGAIRKVQDGSILR